ncbi:hypothetical protein R3I93_019119 [Phoxinus phoxinus]|uniref:Uncharacterized protein n=1 Tax=Phoxinus phoxinus TaxID=58324 RepID=A0AAN9GVR4_9TELE
MNGYTGVVSGRERVEAKRGEKVPVENKYGLENLSRLTLYEASVDCNNRDREIFNYCSPEENKSGCTTKNPR